jgi:hypothetical protein
VHIRHDARQVDASVDATGVPGGRGFAAILRYPW